MEEEEHGEDKRSETTTTASPYQNFDDYRTIQFFESNDRLVAQLNLYLRGLMWVEGPKGGEYKQIGEMIANEQGIFHMLRTVDVLTDKGAFLSGYKREEIMKIMKQYVIEITIFLYENCDRFKIQRRNINILIHEMCSTIESGIRRSIDESEKDFLKGQSVTREILNERGSQGKGSNGFWGSLFGGAK